MQKNKEIWLILDSKAMGGIETHVLQLARSLKVDEIDVRVVRIKDHGKHPLCQALFESGVKQAALQWGVFSLLAAVLRSKPIILHSHGYKAGLFSRLVGCILGVAVIHTHHAGERSSGKLALYTMFDRLTAFMNRENICVSEAIKSQLPISSIKVKNFIDCENVKPSYGDRIAFVGRLSEEKGPDIFIKLAGVFPNKQFHIYGDGPMRLELTRSAPQNCIFHGHKSMAGEWQKIDTLVISSRYEGLPLTALEAMARGIVVIANKVGDLEQLIEHQKNGFLVDANGYEQLLEITEDWLTMPKCVQKPLRDAVRKNAISTIQKFYSTQAVIPEIKKIYGDAVVSECVLGKSNKLLIVHFGEDWLRGSEYCLIELCKQLMTSHWEPVVWCNSPCLAETLQKMGVIVKLDYFSIVAGWTAPRWNLVNYWRLRKNAKQIINKHNIKVIHTNNGAPNQWMIPVAKRLGIPVLCQLHAPYQLRDRVSLLIHEADALVGVSTAVIKPILKHKKLAEKCSVIANGININRPKSIINLRHILTIPPRNPLLISVGSLIERKGFDLLLRALAKLSSQYPAHLVVIGNGSELLHLKELSKQLGISERVHWLGERVDVLDLMCSEVDIFVSGARDEAFGLVLAEAGLAQLPVIAPAVGGIPEVLDNGRCGILVEPENPEAISDAICQLLDNRKHGASLAKKLNERVLSHYGSQQNAENMLKMYDELSHKPNQKCSFYEFRAIFRMVYEIIENRRLKMVGSYE